MSVFIIAEAGSCHEGILDNAKRLIDLAYAVGCDAVKFQFCSNYPQLAKNRMLTKPFYDFSIKKEWLPYLHGYCGDRIEWMCSTYLKEDIAAVAPFVKKFKVASFESQNEEFIEAHPHDRPILISDGERLAGNEFNLHCIALYPCPDDHANLRAIKEWDFDGLSDHTKNPLTGALAVALGARYIEFHIKLKDTTPNCPDYEVARSPEEAHQYIKFIRQAEVLLG